MAYKKCVVRGEKGRMLDGAGRARELARVRTCALMAFIFPLALMAFIFPLANSLRHLHGLDRRVIEPRQTHLCLFVLLQPLVRAQLAQTCAQFRRRSRRRKADALAVERETQPLIESRVKANVGNLDARLVLSHKFTLGFVLVVDIAVRLELNDSALAPLHLRAQDNDRTTHDEIADGPRLDCFLCWGRTVLL